MKGKEEPIDVRVFDIEKFFHALWMQECINNLYEAGLDKDKLPLVYLEEEKMLKLQ